MAVLENRPQEASNFDPIEVCPLLFTTRLSTARMLIELEEWEKATNVLNGLIEEDDEIVDPWYLLGKTTESYPVANTRQSSNARKIQCSVIVKVF